MYASKFGDDVAKQTYSANFMQQCDLFSLDSHHVPWLKI